MLRLMTWTLGLLTAGVGVLHVVWPDPFVRIMPPGLPAPLTLVYVSGVFEILGGLGVLHPQTRRAAAGGLLVLYAMVFPANIYMALAGIDPVPELPGSSLGRYVRLPFQLGLFAWCVALMRGPRVPGELPARCVRGVDGMLAVLGATVPWVLITDGAPWGSTLGMSLGIATAVVALWSLLDAGLTVHEDRVEARRGPWRAVVARAEVRLTRVDRGVQVHTPLGPMEVREEARVRLGWVDTLS